MIVLMRENKVASWLHKLEMSGRLQAYYISLRRPERCFLTIYVICGMLFMIIIPPMQIADESSHFYRAYQVSTGGLISKITPAGVGGVLPSGIVEFTESANKNAISFHPTQRFYPRAQYPELAHLQTNSPGRPVRFVNTALYGPTNYIIPAVAIRVADITTHKVIVAFYLGRLANFVFLAVCLFIAIRLIPRGKWLLAAIGVLPMTLYEAASLSADVYILGIMALFVAYWVSIFNKRQLTNKNWGILGALACS
jgi:uncharacterized membrane protein